MIGYLEGTLKLKEAPEVLLLVGGVGYELEASMQTHYRLPEVGERAELYTHLSIREDAHKLYGFATKEERSLFRILIKVNGVGPKLALQILSSLTPDEFMTRVQNEDVVSLVKLPGIGKKTAERLVIEVKDKLGDLIDQSAVSLTAEQGSREDAVHALMALGYANAEVRAILKTIDTDNKDLQVIIKEALQALANH
jgi:Holliday junction DNA helicase RuvA